LPVTFGTTQALGAVAVLLNVAVAEVGAVIVRVQFPEPEHAPDQPAKVEPASAATVRVTLVPLA
jgi:hypothetical protein